jgi:hypothetical protein
MHAHACTHVPIYVCGYHFFKWGSLIFILDIAKKKANESRFFGCCVKSLDILLGVCAHVCLCVWLCVCVCVCV